MKFYHSSNEHYAIMSTFALESVHMIVPYDY